MTAIDLSGQTAIVTGASRGIGREVARRLAEAGASVALCARSEPALEDLAAELREAHGVQALPLAVDVCSADAVAEAVKRVARELGRIDILVNNAGVTQDTLLARMSVEQWDRVLDTNLKGAFLFAKAVSRPMMKQRSGRIVNISSVVGLRGNAGQCNYAASKAGLLGFTKAVARELAVRGVTVNAVAPGLIETDMTSDMAEEQRAAFTGGIPLGRIGAPSEVASVVLFLVSPLASYVTGAVVPVDGGFGM